MEELEVVSEYWFMDYYRVLVVNLNGIRKFVSVDVYRPGWPFSEHEELCISSAACCLLYKELGASEYASLFDRVSVEKIVVTGVKTNGSLETINVRWFIRGEPTYSDIEKIFRCSWELIGCKSPKDSPRRS